MGSIWWRKKGVKYTNNEIYLDVVEEIDCSIDTNGLMVSCDVSGEILVNCKLSGMPDLTLSFTNPSIIDEVPTPCLGRSACLLGLTPSERVSRASSVSSEARLMRVPQQSRH